MMRDDIIRVSEILSGANEVKGPFSATDETILFQKILPAHSAAAFRHHSFTQGKRFDLC